VEPLLLGIAALTGFSIFGDPKADRLDMEVYRIINARSADFYYAERSGQVEAETFYGGTTMDVGICLACGKWQVRWDSKIHAEGTEAQYRWVGWQWDLSADIVPGKLQIFHKHHSEHWMDRKALPMPDGMPGQFPLKDYVGLRIRFIGK
jgi:hypothetical protein